MTDAVRDRLDTEGFAVVPGVFGPDEIVELLQALEGALSGPAGGQSPIRGDEGAVYAARNVLDLWPGVADAWRRPPLPDLLSAILGPEHGLVRVLYFDKPPGHSWALPWHKDLTIAVQDNHLPSASFGKPTTKVGVPHVEAPREVLEAMLTARVHLDAMTEANGPLQVLPGSHRSGKRLALGEGSPQRVLTSAGDVLLMRPLLAHSSGRSHESTALHRRVLHLEFAAWPRLPDGYTWHRFIAGGR